MPGSKIYVVNTVELVGAVQRQPKVLAFPPIEAKFAMVVCDSSKEANDILKINVNGDEGDWGYSMEFYKSLHPALAPGEGLDAMNRVMIQNIAASTEALKPTRTRATRIGLMEWIRHQITMATTNSVYGPMNPFKDPKIEKAFWGALSHREFERNLVMILVNILPSLTAAKGCHGRAVVARAFEKYFENKGHESGSALVKTRYATSARNKIPLADIARYEVGGAIAILVNTGPALFWMLFFVFSLPEVLEDCRREIQTILTTKPQPDGTLLRSLDVTKMKTKCPILLSTFQEALRHKALGTSVRQVMQDTLLDNRYLLKKDSTILMPNIVVHNDPSVWGSDVHVFRHKRFLREKTATNNNDDSNKRKANANLAAFRGFGSGSTLCPGRHFAMTEILAVVVMFCMRYEIEPVGGQWTAPTTMGSTSAAAGVMEPDIDVEVEIPLRKGFEDGDWAFGLTDSDTVMAVSQDD